MPHRAFVLLIGWLAAGTGLGAEAPNPTSPVPEYAELRDVLRTNLAGTSEAELDAAAARGLLEHLAGRVTLLTNRPAAESSESGPAMAKAMIFDDTSGYIRLARIDTGTDTEFAAALKELTATNELDGLVLDLRFATGTNYDTAARLTGQFTTNAGPILSLGGEEFRAEPVPAPFRQPTMVLVNRRTHGAAEALAAALRQSDAALILGSRTAGGSGLVRELTLSTGHRVRVVVAAVKLGDDARVDPAGIEPDIVVTASLADERRFLDNPFRDAASTNATSAAARSARLTEADLVRMRRERQDPTDRPADRGRPAAAAPVVADPALARALELLKGLAVIKKPRQI